MRQRQPHCAACRRVAADTIKEHDPASKLHAGVSEHAAGCSAEAKVLLVEGTSGDPRAHSTATASNVRLRSYNATGYGACMAAPICCPPSCSKCCAYIWCLDKRTSSKQPVPPMKGTGGCYHTGRD